MMQMQAHPDNDMVKTAEAAPSREWVKVGMNRALPVRCGNHPDRMAAVEAAQRWSKMIRLHKLPRLEWEHQRAALHLLSFVMGAMLIRAACYTMLRTTQMNLAVLVPDSRALRFCTVTPLRKFKTIDGTREFSFESMQLCV
jgi:hypothetical protein